jgi:hypothetical protein
MKYDIIQIEWEDPTSQTGWQDFSRDPVKDFSLATNLTVGFFIAEDADYLVIAGSIGDKDVDPEKDGDHYWGDIFTIPKALVKALNYLGPTKSPQEITEEKYQAAVRAGTLQRPGDLTYVD